MKIKIAKFLFRLAWRLAIKHAAGGFTVNAGGKWQPIKL